MKKLLMPLCLSALTVLFAVNCGPAAEQEPMDQENVQAAAVAKPVPVTACAVDDVGLCANGGAACTKADKTQGKCASTTAGCLCQ